MENEKKNICSLRHIKRFIIILHAPHVKGTSRKQKRKVNVISLVFFTASNERKILGTKKKKKGEEREKMERT